MLIKDDVIVIRHFRETDIPKKIEWINNPNNNKYLHYDLPLKYENTLMWYKNKDNNSRIDGIIEYKNIPVGLIGLLSIDKVNLKAEFYITIGDESYKQKGIATISLKLLVDYAFNSLHLNKVYLNVDADNHAACALYEKVGFICEGTFINDLMRNGVLIDRKRYAIFNKDK